MMDFNPLLDQPARNVTRQLGLDVDLRCDNEHTDDDVYTVQDALYRLDTPVGAPAINVALRNALTEWVTQTAQLNAIHQTATGNLARAEYAQVAANAIRAAELAAAITVQNKLIDQLARLLACALHRAELAAKNLTGDPA